MKNLISNIRNWIVSWYFSWLSLWISLPLPWKAAPEPEERIIYRKCRREKHINIFHSVSLLAHFASLCRSLLLSHESPLTFLFLRVNTVVIVPEQLTGTMCLRLRLWDHIMKIKSPYLTNKWQGIYQVGILALYIYPVIWLLCYLSHFSGSCILISGPQSLVFFLTLFSASSKSWLGNILGIFHLNHNFASTIV